MLIPIRKARLDLPVAPAGNAWKIAQGLFNIEYEEVPTLSSLCVFCVALMAALLRLRFLQPDLWVTCTPSNSS